jgi:hypothetical protein
VKSLDSPHSDPSGGQEEGKGLHASLFQPSFLQLMPGREWISVIYAGLKWLFLLKMVRRTN